MSLGRIFLAVSVPILLGGCASDWHRSYERWRGYTDAPGPYSAWARCIRDRSYHHHNPDGTGVVATDARIFPQVLADCRELMTGSAWNNLSDERMRRLLNDAYQAFRNAGADLMAQQDASTI